MDKFKLLSFDNGEEARAGLLVGDVVYDIASLTGHGAYSRLEAILANWVEVERLLEAAVSDPVGTAFRLSEVRLLAPLTKPGAIYCAGANYQDHVNKMASKEGVDMGTSPRDLGLPPFHFMKSAHCIVGTDASIVIDSDALDFEGELAAVIGRDASNVSVEDALDYVAGYVVANDMSARDRFLRRELPQASPFRFDWIGHKNFDGSCPIGPFFVPAKFIGDPQNLWLKTWVNDDLRQNSNTGHMIYPVAELISALSKCATLRPGDIILSGTPAGVAAETGNFLKSGDVVKVEIEGIGHIENRIVIDRRERAAAG